MAVLIEPLFGRMHGKVSVLSRLPRYVGQELRAYLECGILARAVCQTCVDSLVVAFSLSLAEDHAARHAAPTPRAPPACDRRAAPG